MITEFGKTLRKLRVDYDETLNAMAEKLSITASYLSAIEYGKRNIPIDLIKKLTSIYELNNNKQSELYKAYDKSINRIEIKLPSNNICKRNLALQFAKKLSDMDDDIAVQMLNLLDHNTR